MLGRHRWLCMGMVLLGGWAGTGCQSAPSEYSEEVPMGAGSAEFFATVSQAVSVDEIASVVVTVAASDLSPAMQFQLARVRGQWTGIAGGIPAGTGRTFSAQAFNAAGTLIYEGTTSGVTITAGEVALVSLVLQERNRPPPFSNTAPIIDSLVATASQVVPGGVVDLAATAHDPNPGDAITIAWSADGGSLATPSALSTRWVAPTAEGLYNLTLTVTDPKGLTTRANVSLLVTKSAGRGGARINATFNNHPVVSAISATPTSISVGETVTASATASDADGDPLSYAWSSACAGTWTGSSSASAQFTLSALPPSGTCELVVQVTDGRGGEHLGNVTVHAGPPPAANFAPVVDSTFQATDEAAGSEQVLLRLAAHDPEGTPVSIAWSANVGTLGSDSSTGPGQSTLLWSAPSCFDSPATLTAVITDGTGVSTQQSFSIRPLAGSSCLSGLLNNGSFEAGDYSGWTLRESSGSASAGIWGIISSGTTLSQGQIIHDFHDGIDVSLESPGLPYTHSATDGTQLAIQMQNGPENHRMYQDVTLPAGVTRLSWDMFYKSHAAFTETSQFIALNVRDPATDAVLATPFKTQPGANSLQAMSRHTVDLSAWAGRTVRLDVEMQVMDFHLDAAFDNFRLE